MRTIDASLRQEPEVPPLARKLDLRKTLFLLPNIITLSSVFCGFDSIRISATRARATTTTTGRRSSSCSRSSSTCSTGVWRD